MKAALQSTATPSYTLTIRGDGQRFAAAVGHGDGDAQHHGDKRHRSTTLQREMFNNIAAGTAGAT